MASFKPGGLGPTPLSTSSAPAATAAANAPAAATPVDIWSRVVFQSYRTGNWEIFSMRPDGSDVQQLTVSAGSDGRPKQSHADGRIVFVSNRTGNYEIYTMAPDGSDVRQVTFNPGEDNYPSWSPDGNQIAYAAETETGWDIWMMNADGSGNHRLMAMPEDEFGPAWSPDGPWIAWVRVEKQGFRVWMVHPDGSGPIPTTAPLPYMDNLTWSPDSQRIILTYAVPSREFTWVGFIMASQSDYYWPQQLDAPAEDLTDAQMGGVSPDGKEYIYSLLKYVKSGDNYLIESARLLRRDTNFWSTPINVRPLPDSGVDMLADWQRTDFVAPVTKVRPLPALGGPDGVWAEWTGQDAGGSGIVDYDLQLRKDGGPWYDWYYTNEPNRDVIYGLPGERVEARVRARDAAGNVEPWPCVPLGPVLFVADRRMGFVLDARNRPVAGAQMVSSRFADTPFASAADGSYDVYAFQEINTLGATAKGYALQPESYVWSKEGYDVILTSTAEAVQNGGFEQELQGWQVVGDPNDVRADKDYQSGHSGTGFVYLALGNRRGTYGISQTITVPAATKKPTLSYMVRSYNVIDGAQRDHVFATITEAGSAPQTPELHRTQSGIWMHVWADLTPWAGKQVTLTIEYRMDPPKVQDTVILDEVSVGEWHTPVIASVSGWTGMAGTLTIKGENFEPGATVSVEDTALTTTYVDANTLKAELAPVLKPGPRALWVTNPSGERALTSLRLGIPVFLPFAAYGN